MRQAELVTDTMIRMVAATMFLLLASTALVGCNTVEGAGQDIEAAGDAIEDTARDTKNDLKN